VNDEVGSPRPVCLACFASVAAAGLGSPCSVYLRVILPHVHSLSCRGFSLADRASGKPSLMGRRFSLLEFPTATARKSMTRRWPPMGLDITPHTRTLSQNRACSSYAPKEHGEEMGGREDADEDRDARVDTSECARAFEGPMQGSQRKGRRQGDER